MGTKTFNNYEDLLTFTRASNGHALRPVSYGAEIIQNGTYDSDLAGWDDDSLGSGTATVSSGQVSLTRTDASNKGVISQSHTLVTGSMYLVSFELVSGAVQVKYKGGSGSLSQTFNGENWNQLSTAGVYQTRFVATGTDGDIELGAINNGVTAVIDNVSVKEVTFDESDGTLTLFEHPNNVPRVEWDADRNKLGLLVEEARTNLVTSSDATGWAVAAASATDNTETTLGAFTGAVVSSNGADWHRLRPANITVTSGTTYAVTLFYEYGTSDDVLLNFRDVSAANESRITGAWGSLTIPYQNAGTLTILEETALPQNVKKVVAKFVPNFSGNFEIGIGPNSNTSGETVIAYAAQCEQASFGTSYIKTTGATATRSADVASIPVADFGFNQSAGSLLVQCQHFTTETGATAAAAVAIDDGSSSNRMWYYQNKGQWIGSSGGATQFSITGGDLAEDTEVKAGMVYSKDDFALYVDGSSVGADTSGSVAVGATTLHVGKAGGATVPLNGHIKSIKYYPRRLTNAQLQDITS